MIDKYPNIASLIHHILGGVLIGSLIMRKIPVRGLAGKAALICFIMSIVGLATNFVWIIPGCNNTNMAGIQVPYSETYV